MNSIISWVGGKKALRDLIYLRMPTHYDRYIEVFGGGGWVLFGKPPDKWRFTMISIRILQTSFIVSRKDRWLCFGNCLSCH